MTGASVTGFPVGTTNAIGCTGPERGGGSEAGRTVGAVAFSAETSGSGSSRAISAEVSAGVRVETVEVPAATRMSGVVTRSLPSIAVASIAISGRPLDGGGAVGMLATGTGAGAGRVAIARGGGVHPGSSSVHAVHRQTNALPRGSGQARPPSSRARVRRMWPC